MGLRVNKTVDRVAGAAAKAISDTRKNTAVTQTVVFGSITLVAGTLAVTGKGLTTASFVSLMLTTPGGGTNGSQYKVTGVGTTGGFTVTAVSTAGATVATDVSVLSYWAATPLFHGDQTSQYGSGDAYAPSFTNLSVTAATAVDLPTTITAANQIRQVMLLMMADTVAHLVSDTTNIATLAAVPVAIDLPSVQTLLNQEQTSFNAHLTQAGVHVFNDTVNTNATTAASNLATSQTLANAMAASVNAHLASAPVGESVTVDPT